MGDDVVVAYDEELADRIRSRLFAHPGLSERRMFGGLAFLLDGHMAVAVSGEGGLMVRAGADQADQLLQEPHVGQIEMRGRPMTGWLRVDAAALEAEAELGRWIDVGAAFVASLPPKS